VIFKVITCYRSSSLNLDIDKLLWFKVRDYILASANQVKYLVTLYTESQIIAAELERIAPLLPLSLREMIYFITLR